jgi:hypothetical protein
VNAREEIQLVLKIVLKYARKQLEEEGGFQAYGATFGSHRDVLMLLPESQPDDASFADVREHWYRALRKAIDDGGCRTAAWCCNVKAPGENDTRVPAVFVHVEHVEGQAWDMYFPFVTDPDSKVLYGEQTELAVKSILFTREAPSTAAPDPPKQ